MSKSIELRAITVCLEVLNTRLSLIAVMLSGGSGGVVFKVGLEALEHLRSWVYTSECDILKCGGA